MRWVTGWAPAQPRAQPTRPPEPGPTASSCSSGNPPWLLIPSSITSLAHLAVQERRDVLFCPQSHTPHNAMHPALPPAPQPLSGCWGDWEVSPAPSWCHGASESLTRGQGESLGPRPFFNSEVRDKPLDASGEAQEPRGCQALSQRGHRSTEGGGQVLKGIPSQWRSGSLLPCPHQQQTLLTDPCTPHPTQRLPAPPNTLI